MTRQHALALRGWSLRAMLLGAVLFLCGCAHMAAPPAEEAHWQGRLALKVWSKPVQALSANFDLQGRPEKGELLLSTPLGTTLARLQWDEGLATLSANGEKSSYGSLQELARKATGTELPVASLFAWLQGRAQSAPGWLVDLKDLPQGRLQASHTEEVQAELKIILDQ